MKILAIDPGNKLSGFVVFDSKADEVVSFGKITNDAILKMANTSSHDITLIEKPDFISVGAGSTVIDTIFWAGRFRQEFKGSIVYGRSYLKRSYGLKNDAAVIKFIKENYPDVKLKADSWQAFLLIHAYLNTLI